MISITHNGFKIDFETIEEVTAFVESKKGEPKKKLGRPPKFFKDDEVEKVKKEPRKLTKLFTMKHRWTDSEIVHLVMLLEEEKTPGQIQRDTQLRARHNEHAIKQMMQKFKNATPTSTSEAVKRAIIAYAERNNIAK